MPFHLIPSSCSHILGKTASLVAVLCLCAAAALAQEAPGPLVYETRIKGAPTPQCEQLLKDSLNTVSLQDTPPSFRRLLSSRAANDLSTIEKVLKSLGYFQAQASFSILWDEEPIPVVFGIESGPAFTLGEVRVETTGPASAQCLLPQAEGIGLPPGEPYQATAIVEAQDTLLRRITLQGFPFARLDSMDLVADHATKTVNVRFLVDAGPQAVFGETSIQGLAEVKEAYVREKIPWQSGQRYTPELVEEARRLLLATGLFSKANVMPSTVLDAEERLPVGIDLVERKHRTFSAGAFYRTDIGPGVKTDWEHRNLFGQAERLKLDLTVAQYLQSLDALYREGEFLRPDQALLLTGQASNSVTQAYESTGVELAGGLERKLGQNATVDLGLGYRLSRVKAITDDEIDTYGLVSLPVSLALEGRDNPLDPQRGYRLAAEAAPYLDTLGSGNSFVKLRLSAGLYLPLWPEHLTLALRGAVGSAVGSSLGDIPLDLRFYSGGGGSIRGYGHQLAGELDEQDNPVGGRSLVEATVELRFKVYEDVGLALFVDAGRAYADTLPTMDEDLFWAAGLGLRYFTEIGPLRLDVAFPMNTRKDVDPYFQVYMSLGQAF